MRGRSVNTKDHIKRILKESAVESKEPVLAKTTEDGAQHRVRRPLPPRARDACDHHGTCNIDAATLLSLRFFPHQSVRFPLSYSSRSRRTRACSSVCPPAPSSCSIGGARSTQRCLSASRACRTTRHWSSSRSRARSKPCACACSKRTASASKRQWPLTRRSRASSRASSCCRRTQPARFRSAFCSERLHTRTLRARHSRVRPAVGEE